MQLRSSQVKKKSCVIILGPIVHQMNCVQPQQLLWSSGRPLPKPTCRRTTRTNITINLHGFSARIFARIFCADFFARFFARFFYADICADCLQELFVQMFARILHGFFGVSQNTCWEAPKFHRKSPEKFTMLWGPSGRGSGGRRVR